MVDKHQTAAATNQQRRWWKRLASILTVLLVSVGALLTAPTDAAGQTENEAGPTGDEVDRADDTGSSAIGGGRPIEMGRPTWDTGWFQAEVYRRILVELGFRVDRPKTYDNAAFFEAAAAAEVDFWANGWFPLFDRFMAGDVKRDLEVVGTQVRGGALQGYLIDNASVDTFGIDSIADLADPEVAKHFDNDGDGKADLVGCNLGWVCGDIINHHLEEYGLGSTVKHIRGDYGPLAADAIDRHEKGGPLLLFTWTPNWTIGLLKPGEGVRWLGVPYPSLPPGLESIEHTTLVDDVTGCDVSPCPMGFPANDIRVVANQKFLDVNPALRSLLSSVKIPFEDIAAQNARLLIGEDEQDDIERHAADWVRKNRAVVDEWQAAAVAAHDEQLVAQARTTPADSADEMTPRSVRVVTKELEPFVTYDVVSQEYTGFSIELWNLIAEEANLNYEIYGVDTVAKLLDDIDRGAADVATAGIGITEQRETLLEFSHPYFQSGLQIMVSAEDDNSAVRTVWSVVRSIFNLRLVGVLAVLVFCLAVAANIMWLAERRVNEDFSTSYWPGVWEAFWWSAVTATTVGYGDKTPKTGFGQIVGLMWMFSGLFVLASFTASIATAFAVDEVTSQISGPLDLAGKTVATIDGSTSEEYLLQAGIQPLTFEHEAEAYGALLAGEVDAVVYDAPVLQHFAANEGAGKLRVVGPTFREQQYGFGLSDDNALRERVNRALLRLVESGRYESLRQQWFGPGQ